MASSALYGDDKIHRSPRPPISLPIDPNHSMLPIFFQNLPSLAHFPALIDADSGESLTFSALKREVLAFSSSLPSLGVTRNDVILICAPNSICFPVCFLGIVAIGAVGSTVNPQYTVRELSDQVNDCKPKLIITTVELYNTKVKDFNLPAILLGPKPLAQTTPIPIPSKTWYYQDLIATSSSAALSDFPTIPQTSVAALLYSSGTTGKNKGVILTHRNFIAGATMVTSDQEHDKEYYKTILCFLPMFHIFGLLVLTLAQLQMGNAVVVMPRFEIDKFLGSIARFRVTDLFVVPPVILNLVKHKDLCGNYNLSSVREIMSSAAPLSNALVEGCAKIFPQAAIFQGYGMTETCGPITIDNPKLRSKSPGSVGFLVQGVESRIVSVETLQSLPPNQLGEIWVRGPNVMQGYLNMPEATNSTVDSEGWVHTGDLGYFDFDGRLHIVDRIKDLIKCKGFQVAPAELESLLFTHPGILDAAVVPFPDDEAGQVPIAFVVRSSCKIVTEEEIKSFIAKQVATYKRLRRVIFAESIPKLASGKILRRELTKNVTSKL